MARVLSSLPVGAKVVDNDTKYNDAPIVWVIGGHNHYAQGQTVLVSEKIITLKAFDAKEPTNPSVNGRNAYGNNRWLYSNLRSWLNSDKNNWYTQAHLYDSPPTSTNVENGYNGYDSEYGFLTNFGSTLRSSLQDTELLVARNNTDGGGSETVIDKVFLLSKTEVGLSDVNSIAEGKKLPLFTTSDSSRVAKPTSEAISKSEYSNSGLTIDSGWNYYLRTPSAPTSESSPYYVRFSGQEGSGYSFSGSRGIRPSINVKSDLLVSDSPNSNGEYEVMPAHITPSDKTELGNISDRTLILKYTPKVYAIGTTVTEKINGVVVGTKTIINDTEYTVSATAEQWDTVKYGKYKDTLGNKNVVILEVSNGEIYTYPFTKTLPTTAKTNDVLVAVNDMANTAMASHKKNLVDAIGNKATIGGTGTLEDIAKAIESISVESMGGMKTAKGTFTTSMDDIPKVSVRGLAFKPKGILYKTPTGNPCGVYFIKEFYDGNIFRGDMTFDRISSGATSVGTSYFTPVDGGFDAMIGSYTERGTIYDYVVFG